MGFGFHRSISVLPGIRVNLSKSGGSLSLGGPGAPYKTGTGGTREMVGLPRTGLSWSGNRSYRGGRVAGPWPRVLFIAGCVGMAIFRLMS